MNNSDLAREIVEALARAPELDRIMLRQDVGVDITDSRNWSSFYRNCPTIDRRMEPTVFALMCICALTSNSVDAGNLGQSMRTLAARTAINVDRRLESLLDADDEQALRYVGEIARMMATTGVSINQYQLIRDMMNWNHPDRYVQTNIARSYYKE